MKPSGIGGQAVMEGVMMKNKEKYAVAVRKPDEEIVVDVKTYGEKSKWKVFRRIPFVRGIFNFGDSLFLGTKVLTYSASFFEEEEPEEGNQKKSVSDSGEESVKDTLLMVLTVCFSIVMSIALFLGLPFGITELFRKYVTDTQWVIIILEGVIRIAIFLLYIVLISRMKDIQRFFMYHGAEHKCINCIENGWELNVENARKASRQHKRCGTSFLLIVMVVSIIFLFFVQAENRWMRLLIRLALIPVIAGVSYEFIRLAGSTDNRLVGILSKPGMWLQNLTTREPEDEMLEVAIASVEAVFDWKVFLQDQEIEELGEKNAKSAAGSPSDIADTADIADKGQGTVLTETVPGSGNGS